MSSYFLLHTGLCRDIEDGASKKKKCTWKQEYFYLEAGKLASISEYEDGLIYRSAAGPFTVPVGAQPSTAEVYDAALARWQVVEDARLAKEAQEKEMKKLLKKGMTVHEHASVEAGAAEEVAPQPTPAVWLNHFLDDFTILDFETANDKPIELAAVRYQNWQEVARMQSFVALPAGEFVPSRISELTGITNSMLRGAPDYKKVLQQFKKLAGESLLIAHNVTYDRRILEKARTELGASAPLVNQWLCTLTVARVLFPQEPCHKLPDLCRSFRITVVGSHRALNDVLMTEQLLRTMHQQSPIAETLVGQTSVAKARKAAAQPTLFAA